MESSSYEVLPAESHEVQILQVDAVERANVDSQVATAKRYPRDIRRSIDNSVVMATMNQDTVIRPSVDEWSPPHPAITNRMIIPVKMNLFIRV